MFKVEVCDSGQLMICSLGDVICLSDANVTPDDRLKAQFDAMCGALNKPKGCYPSMITKASQITEGMQVYYVSGWPCASATVYWQQVVRAPYPGHKPSDPGCLKIDVMSGGDGLSHHYLRDCGIGANYNGHRLFTDEEEAKQYAIDQSRGRVWGASPMRGSL